MGRAATHWCVDATVGDPCAGLGQQTAAERSTSPGLCAPIDNRDSALLLGSVRVGAFATNLLYAASRVRTRHFLLGTTLGTFPETLVYALLGAGVRSASSVRLGVAAVLLLSLAIVHLRYSTRRAPALSSAVEKLGH